MKQHIAQQQQQQQENQTTPRRPQEDIDQETKLDKIKHMLTKQTLTIGFAPITNQHLQNVEKTMLERGVLNTKQPWDERKKRTIKSVVKNWAIKNLKMSETDWNQIDIDQIHQTITEDSDIIFVKCHTQADTQIITSHAKNLPVDESGNGPRLVNFIDNRAKARYRGYQQIAKTLREESNTPIQTNIRTGRMDFLLQVRKKGENTPWSTIAPLKINQKIPNFEVGIFKNIFELSLSSDSGSEDDQNTDENNYEMQQIQNDLESENEDQRKRNRISDEDEKSEQDRKQIKIKGTPHPRGRGIRQVELPETTSDSSDEDTRPPPPSRILAVETPERNKQQTYENTEMETIEDTPAPPRTKQCTKPNHGQ